MTEQKDYSHVFVFAALIFLMMGVVIVQQNPHLFDKHISQYVEDSPPQISAGDPYSYGYMPHYVSIKLHPNQPGETVLIKTEGQPTEIGVTNNESEVVFKMIPIYKYTVIIDNFKLVLYPVDSSYEIWTGEKP